VLHGNGSDDSTGNTTGTSTTNVNSVAGQVGRARDFVGDDSTQQHTNAADQIAGDFTLELWFRLDAGHDDQTAGTQLLLTRFLDNDNGLLVALAGDDYVHDSKVAGALVIKVERPSSQYYYVWSDRTSWQADTWYHLALAADASAQSGTRLYVDGVLAGHTLGGTSNPSNLNFDADLTLGAGSVDTTNIGGGSLVSFRGTLDEVRLRAGMKQSDRVNLETKLQRAEQLSYGAVESAP
jgi:hypothetical protein